MKFCLQKHSILLFGGLCCIFSSASAAGDEVPAGFPVERYSVLWQHSPFTIASVQQTEVPAGFAQNLTVVGIAKIGDKDLVTLLNKQSLERFIVKAEPNAQGMKVLSVENDSDPLKTSVMLQSGGEIAKVGFDKSLIQQNQSAPHADPNAVAQNTPVAGQPPSPPADNMPPVPGRRVRRLPAIPALNPAPASGGANAPQPPPNQ